MRYTKLPSNRWKPRNNSSVTNIETTFRRKVIKQKRTIVGRLRRISNGGRTGIYISRCAIRDVASLIYLYGNKALYLKTGFFHLRITLPIVI